MQRNGLKLLRLARRGLNERLSAVYRLLRPTAPRVRDSRCEEARKERALLKNRLGKSRLGIGGMSVYATTLRSESTRFY